MKKKEPWYVRLARTMGLDPYSKKAADQKKVKPAGFRAKRKARRIMARTSRRINRQRA